MAASTPIPRTIYLGPFVHSTSLTTLEIAPEGAIGVDEDGIICFVEQNVSSLDNLITSLPSSQVEGWTDAKIVSIDGSSGFFFPGFIDTHVHAPQHPNTGLFGKTTLLDWLQKYTFPTESSFSDLQRAHRVYQNFVSRTLSHGTTTAAYYATIHVPATNALADICLERGQRALVGRVCMNSDLSPEYYRDESTESSYEDSKASIDYIRSIDPKGEIVKPIITPRFAPSCTESCLTAMGKLAKETDAHIQTHISENKGEIELVNSLFPDSKNYADVYDSHGLMNEKTILAHCVHLEPEERKLILERKSKISHCPASNTAITSGCAPIRDLLDEGHTIGLGTDISGGFSPSILENVRQAIWVSRHLCIQTSVETAKLSTEEALYLATRGGAAVVGMEDKVGGFEVGKEWDAQMINLGSVSEGGCEDGIFEQGPVDVFGWESWPDKVEKWVYSGDDRNTVAVWVKGRIVHMKSGYPGEKRAATP
ncbi:guanine deaminase [Stemphylium lycopersici]|uniref:Guanine deaminase n=1 Tax=Stemphylium lycopersici TaxID=183478 RepID=A0A364NGA3_STELY|nr:guanine deaminase [Stemphylium lycopersici]RAR05074.1 guanine deaminase [Stemphylium lycopersici]RAR16300.1 guanine deaminase [Stemphylium lycopersici]